ncbi:hypothetical protein M404DRAFT_753986 [Pisolithus tinctorius Marx 270]|uniref:Uncharacterized protein n=1 Tax=Pisolithus tinctorius Marx 270 TaxID=870435 RepID=A0A0C3P019_PISTI|nr:hypothetical protein M404DRAFT_753986 [Pisolithus tinctorius Marx 270]
MRSVYVRSKTVHEARKYCPCSSKVYNRGCSIVTGQCPPSYFNLLALNLLRHLLFQGPSSRQKQLHMVNMNASPRAMAVTWSLITQY